MKLLGIHFGHDSNAALIVDGRIIAVVSEERLNRIKHASDPPFQSLAFCLETGNLSIDEIDIIAVSGRHLHDDFHKVFDTGRDDFIVPSYQNRFRIKEDTRILSFDHHLCHASISYQLSGFSDTTLILVSDGVGDDCSISVWTGENGKIELIQKYPSSGSLGWFYSNVTEAMGWIHGDGEGKTMALASTGNPGTAMDDLLPFSPNYHQGKLIKPRDFGEVGSFLLRGSNQWFLKDAHAIEDLFGQYRKEDIAATAQKILETEHTNLVQHWMELKGIENLCVSGGVFLNILLNRKLANLSECKELYITPEPGDSGLALGAALTALSQFNSDTLPEKLETIYLGPEYSNDEIHQFLKKQKLDYENLDDEPLLKKVANYLANHKCVGWFQGRMEMGPRALGNRSILMRSSRLENKDYVNRNVKFRESFRPFCPTLLEEDRDQYLAQDEEGKYMVLAFESLGNVLEKFPAVAHVDNLIRPQILSRQDNPLYYRLIESFKEFTGESILLNTSFNIKGEPIVCTPADAVRCFYSSGMDVLVMGNFLLKKNK
ncbi:MAG: hypothetical protein PF503_20290 [Desulfobacula sp.]|jgi:carbamoyltransferase|nr:hypothetical protein [Desulfobacula sp.]